MISKNHIYLFSQTKNNLQQTLNEPPTGPQKILNRTHNEQKIPKLFRKFQIFQQRILDIANQIITMLNKSSFQTLVATRMNSHP